MWWFIKKIAETDTEVAYGYESKELTGSFSVAKNLTFFNMPKTIMQIHLKSFSVSRYLVYFENVGLLTSIN